MRPVFLLAHQRRLVAWLCLECVVLLLWAETCVHSVDGYRALLRPLIWGWMAKGEEGMQAEGQGMEAGVGVRGRLLSSLPYLLALLMSHVLSTTVLYATLRVQAAQQCADLLRMGAALLLGCGVTHAMQALCLLAVLHARFPAVAAATTTPFLASWCALSLTVTTAAVAAPTAALLHMRDKCYNALLHGGAAPPQGITSAVVLIAKTALLHAAYWACPTALVALAIDAFILPAFPSLPSVLPTSIMLPHPLSVTCGGGLMHKAYLSWLVATFLLFSTRFASRAMRLFITQPMNFAALAQRAARAPKRRHQLENSEGDLALASDTPGTSLILAAISPPLHRLFVAADKRLDAVVGDDRTRWPWEADLRQHEILQQLLIKEIKVTSWPPSLILDSCLSPQDAITRSLAFRDLASLAQLDRQRRDSLWQEDVWQQTVSVLCLTVDTLTIRLQLALAALNPEKLTSTSHVAGGVAEQDPGTEFAADRAVRGADLMFRSQGFLSVWRLFFSDRAVVPLLQRLFMDLVDSGISSASVAEVAYATEALSGLLCHGVREDPEGFSQQSVPRALNSLIALYKIVREYSRAWNSERGPRGHGAVRSDLFGVSIVLEDAIGAIACAHESSLSQYAFPAAYVDVLQDFLGASTG